MLWLRPGRMVLVLVSTRYDTRLDTALEGDEATRLHCRSRQAHPSAARVVQRVLGREGTADSGRVRGREGTADSGRVRITALTIGFDEFIAYGRSRPDVLGELHRTQEKPAAPVARTHRRLDPSPARPCPAECSQDGYPSAPPASECA